MPRARLVIEVDADAGTIAMLRAIIDAAAPKVRGMLARIDVTVVRHSVVDVD